MSKFDALLRNLGCSWCWLETKHQQEKLNEETDQPPVFFVMGPSSSGKSTVGRNLALSIGYTYANSSALIESEIEKGGETAAIIIRRMKAGLEIPTEITTGILIRFIEQVQNAKGFVLSGFPNSVEEAKKFELDYYKPKVIVYCSVPRDVYVERNLRRHQGVDIKFLNRKYADEHKIYQELYRLHEHKTLKVTTNTSVHSNNEDLIRDLELYWGFNFNQ